MTSDTGMTRRRFLRAGTLASGALMAGGTAEAAALFQAVGPLHLTPPLRIRPTVERRDSGTVAIAHYSLRLPLAYYERRSGRLYVDRQRRAQIARALDAQVQGKVWTFAGRQAAEMDIGRWDVTRRPEPGDVRVVDRAYLPVRWEINCLPVYDSEPRVWWEGPAIEHGQARGEVGKPCREDYTVVGRSREYADPACTRLVGSSQVLNWVARTRQAVV